MADERGQSFVDDVEVKELFRRFESCDLGPAQFKHRDHLTVALCYLLGLSDDEALAQMRQGLFRFIEAHGITPGLYNETLTVFWLKRVRTFIQSQDAHRTLAELANALARECGDSRLVYEYFSKTLVDSEAAKGGWVEPDVKPLDF